MLACHPLRRLGWFTLVLVLSGGQQAIAQVTAETLIGPIVPNFEKDKDKYADVDRAIEEIKKGDVEAARTLLIAAKKDNPILPPARVMMGQLLIAAGQGPAARVEFERAVLDAPTDPEAYLVFGEAALRERRVTDAELLYKEGQKRAAEFKENPKRLKNFQIAAYAGLAAVAESREQWQKAVDQLTEWAKVAKDSAAPHQRMGQAIFRLKKFKEAQAEFEAAQKLDPKQPAPEVLMAAMYAQTGKEEDKQAGKTLIETAVKKNPKDPVTLLAAARWAYQSNDFKKSKTYADAALANDKESLEAKLLCGTIARQTKDSKEASNQFQEALKQDPGNFLAANALAVILVEATDDAAKQKALKYAATNVKQNPKSAEAAATLAWVYHKLGKSGEAARAMQAAVSAGTLTADSAYYVANILEQQGNVKDAKTVLEKALETTQPFPDKENAEQMLSRLRSGKPTSTTPKRSAKDSKGK